MININKVPLLLTFSITVASVWHFSPLENHNLTSDWKIGMLPAHALPGSLYIPPTTKPSSPKSEGSGSRGGCHQAMLGKSNLVNLLIPSQEYVAQTNSGYPTFFWSLSNAVSVPVEFALVKPGVAEPILVKRVASAPAGLVKVKLPAIAPELEPGEIYRWSVSLICNEKRPSANPLFYSWIERKETSPQIASQLAAVPEDDAHARALVYGQAGLWYDMVAELHKAKAANPENTRIRQDFDNLIRQAGLEAAAKP